MKVLLCIDGTFDQMGNSNTIKIMNYIKKHIMYNKYGSSFDITKHTLLNSNTSICMEIDIIEKEYEELIKDSKDIIKENSSEISSPGICAIMVDKVINKDELIKFGLKSKVEEIEKNKAIMLALKSGLYLKGINDNNDGIVGALAGATLRLSGNDGQVYKEEN